MRKSNFVFICHKDLIPKVERLLKGNVVWNNSFVSIDDTDTKYECGVITAQNGVSYDVLTSPTLSVSQGIKCHEIQPDAIKVS